jgi:hypothetical protein
MTEIPGVNPEVPPSGTGCVECLAAAPSGWWFHLRRCTSAAMSGAVTHHRTSTRVRITRTLDTGISRASSRARTGTGTSPPATTPTAHSWHRRHTIRRTSLCPGPRESSPPPGRNDCIADQASRCSRWHCGWWALLRPAGRGRHLRLHHHDSRLPKARRGPQGRRRALPPVPLQYLDSAFLAGPSRRHAARSYSLISPPRTCLRATFQPVRKGVAGRGFGGC